MKKKRVGTLLLLCLLFSGGCGSVSPRCGIERTGPFTEFCVSVNIQSSVVGITTGPDGALWFTDGEKIGRITVGGKISEFPLPAPNYVPREITAGPDGALWFTELTAITKPLQSKIGRITVGGKISEFLLPEFTPISSWAGGITAGPDGALWFTDPLGKIGRITVGGKISEFPLPAPNHWPEEITAGSDGALWFTERITSRGKPDQNGIGRITVGGKISEFLLPGLFILNGFTAGPDGALWFTEYRGKIGRLTTQGQISEFPLPAPSYWPRQITTGPDGALWFTENPPRWGEVPGPEGALWLSGSPGGGEQFKGGKIGRITLQGQISEFALPNPDRILSGITAGPDGALWFTEPPETIGRLSHSPLHQT